MVVVHFEGNIGAGKSTLARTLKIRYPNNVIIVKEMIDEWINMGIWNDFCINPQFMAPLFELKVVDMYHKQMLDHLTLMVEKFNDPNYLVIFDRSIFSPKHVFIPVMKQEGWISHVHEKILIDAINKWLPAVAESQFLFNQAVWITTPPNICLDNIRKRNRVGEGTINLKYLEELHAKHEEWFFGNNWPEHDDEKYITISFSSTSSMLQQLKGELTKFLPLANDETLSPALHLSADNSLQQVEWLLRKAAQE